MLPDHDCFTLSCFNVEILNARNSSNDRVVTGNNLHVMCNSSKKHSILYVNVRTFLRRSVYVPLQRRIGVRGLPLGECFELQLCVPSRLSWAACQPCRHDVGLLSVDGAPSGASSHRFSRTP